MRHRTPTLLASAVVVASIVVLGALAQAGDEWTVPGRAARKANPVPADAASIAAGKVVYGKECQSCHGDSGKGDGPAAADLEKNPGDLTKPAMWSQTDGALFYKITEGRKPMPAFEAKLSEEQRWQVVNYIRTLAPKPAGK